MEKFVPYEKLSKKEKRRLDRAKRQTWGDRNPVTRKPENSRAYNRKRAQKQWASALFQTVKEGIFRCIPHSRRERLWPFRGDICFNVYRLNSASQKNAQCRKAVIPKPVGISGTAVPPVSQPINIVNPEFRC